MVSLKKSQLFMWVAVLALMHTLSPAETRSFQGGYVGGGLGIVQLVAKTSQSSLGAPDGKKRPRGSSLGGEIAVGYGLNICNHFFWGTELFFELAAPKIKTSAVPRIPMIRSARSSI